MVTKSIPDQILEEFMNSLKKSELFDTHRVLKIKKILESDKKISKSTIISALSSEVANEGS